MVKNKTRQKPVNAWVSLCLVTKRLANWGELLSDRPLVRTQPGVPKMTAVSRFLMVCSGFCYHFIGALLPLRRNNFIHFRCMPANWLRTIFPALLIKNTDLLIRFSRPIFRMGPTPAMQPVCWPVPATCEAAPPGPPNPMWRAPVPLVPPGDEPNAGRDWHRRRSQTSGR